MEENLPPTIKGKKMKIKENWRQPRFDILPTTMRCLWFIFIWFFLFRCLRRGFNWLPFDNMFTLLRAYYGRPLMDAWRTTDRPYFLLKICICFEKPKRPISHKYRISILLFGSGNWIIPNRFWVNEKPIINRNSSSVVWWQSFSTLLRSIWPQFILLWLCGRESPNKICHFPLYLDRVFTRWMETI